LFSLLAKLWTIPSPRERGHAIVLVALMVVSAFLEVIGIGLIIPVIALLAKPELAEQSPIILLVKRFLGPSVDNEGFILILCIVIILLFLGKNIFLATQAYLQARFAFGLGGRLASRLFEKYLRAPYAFHLQRNSGHLMGSLGLASGICSGIMMPGMIILSEAIIVIIILAVLLVLSPWVTLCLISLIALFSAAIYFPMRTRNFRLGVAYRNEAQALGKYSLQGLKGVKESKVRNAEGFFIVEYARHQHAFNRTLASQSFLGNLPRFAIEAMIVSLGMGTLAILILANVATGSIILTLSLLAVSLVRLMPSFSRIQYNLATIRQQQHNLDQYHAEAVDLPPEDKTPKRPDLPFHDKITIDHLSFRYAPDTPDVLANFSLDIPRNASVAFVGPTGCGKTTLVDLILGLLKPTAGAIRTDGIDIEQNLPAWQTRIGYVPQFIFLLDESIKANVAFGIPDHQIDDNRIRECLQTAQILDFVDSLPNGLETLVGDNGIRLSGGQRQRVGIARALYHHPEILILDEATSALDNDTEKAFVDALKNLHGKLTILIVAHRLTTVQNCDQVVKMA
jgi:ATP-binding cassette subfamily C protein